MWAQPMFGWVLTGFRPWFAWRPVDTVDEGWVWGRRVWRRRVIKKAHLPGPGESWFQYAVTPPAETKEVR